MLINYFLHGDMNETVVPADPEFVLENVVFSITIYEYVKHTVQVPPGFHLQKHGEESLERDMVFMRGVKTSFSQALSFKPNIFNALNTRIDDMCENFSNKKKQSSTSSGSSSSSR